MAVGLSPRQQLAGAVYARGVFSLSAQPHPVLLLPRWCPLPRTTIQVHFSP